MADATQFGSFVPTNFIWDVQQLNQVDVNSPEFKELLVRLYQNINLMAIALNTKDSAYYNTQEFVNGQLYFPNPSYNSSTAAQPGFRQVYRKVLNYTTALPNNGSTSIAHGISCTAQTTFTRIYATASDITGFNYIPIPYASPTLANNIELRVDATNVTITTGSNRTNFTKTYIVLEYMQA